MVGGGVENLQDHPRHSVAQSRRHEWRAPLGQQEAGGVRWKLRHLHENQVYERLDNMGADTVSSSRIFDDYEMELTVRELARLERDKSEESGAKKRVRRLKQGSCSSSVGDDSLFAGQPLVKGSSKQQSSEKMKKEKLIKTG